MPIVDRISGSLSTETAIGDQKMQTFGTTFSPNVCDYEPHVNQLFIVKGIALRRQRYALRGRGLRSRGRPATTSEQSGRHRLVDSNSQDWTRFAL